MHMIKWHIQRQTDRVMHSFSKEMYIKIIQILCRQSLSRLKNARHVSEIDIHALTWHSKSSVRVLYIKYLFLISLRF